MIPVMIVPVLYEYEKLNTMLDTVDYHINHIIIVDNGGGLKRAECEYANEISIINLPYNLGISTAYNLGIKLTPMSKYWLFAQDDMTWIPGGLEKIHNISGSDYFCFDMTGPRAFVCRTIGENVIKKVGLLDESYFPAPGDEFNYHKRCHYNDIEEKDISGTFLAQKSSTIKKMMADGEINLHIWNENLFRSLCSYPIDAKWNLSRRRSQEASNIKPDRDEFERLIINTISNDGDFIHSLGDKYYLNLNTFKDLFNL